MKKIWFLAVVIMLMAMVTSAQAEVKAGSVSVTPFFGGYIFESNEEDIDDTWTAGGRVGYNFTDHLGVEATFNYIFTEGNMNWKVMGDDIRISGLGVEALYHFFPDGNIVPFVAVGLGGMHYDFESKSGTTDKLFADYGAGLKLFLPEEVANVFFADDIALRFDVRHVIPFDEDSPHDRYNNLMYTAGINFAFGGKGKKCIDSDGDGVCDKRDKCADTPAGCKVDENGCSHNCPAPEVKTEPVPVTPTAPAPAPAPAPVKEKVTITLNVEFNNAKAIVNEKYYEDIKRVADFMKQYPTSTAVIEGHTDNVGNDAYNKTLSEKRANSVRQYIIDKFGIEASRLTAVGYGKTRPIAGNDTEEGRHKNRRVEAVLESVRIVK
jgi:OmpA-OmpF porin, OOP family